MEERVIKIVGDTSDADKKVNKLTDDIKKLDKTANKANENASKGVDNLGKSADKTNKKVGFLRGGLQKLGTVIKASGIGLFVTLVASLGVAFSKNQRVMDAFNTVTETLGIILSQVATALINVYDSVSANTENFDALGRVLKGLLTLAVTPLKLAFFGIKLAIQESQLAWEKSVFGGKDENKIKELTKSIEETNKNLQKTGIDAIVAGKGIVDNFGEAITEVADIGSKAVDELGKISVKSAIETAKTNVQIKNTAMLAVAEQGRLVEVYDRLAEKQRQIRDDESISIKERIKANEELGKVLEKQEEALLKQANAQIASAQVELKKNNTIENQVALTEALANKEGVLAQIEGFRSEQLVNRIALQKEEIELTNTISDAEKERRLKQLEFEASQAEREEYKINLLQERLDLENEIILQDLERKRELFALGTQARVDAEQEFLDRKQELENKQRELDLEAVGLFLDEEERLAVEAEDKRLQRALEEIELNKKVQDAKKEIQQATLSTASNGISLLKQIFEKNKALQKGSIIAESAIGIAKIVNNTQAANAAARLKYALLPGGQALAATEIALNKVNAGIGIGANLAATAKALSSIGGGGSANANGSNTEGGAQAPSFSLVEGTGSNQIANTITQEQRPVQAFVVGSNVNSQAELDRQRTANSSI